MFSYTASACTVVTDAANPDGSTYNLVNGDPATDDQCCLSGAALVPMDDVLLTACPTEQIWTYVPYSPANSVDPEVPEYCDSTTNIMNPDLVTVI